MFQSTPAIVHFSQLVLELLATCTKQLVLSHLQDLNLFWEYMWFDHVRLVKLSVLDSHTKGGEREKKAVCKAQFLKVMP